jgi:hypothetical protein
MQSRRHWPLALVFALTLGCSDEGNNGTSETDESGETGESLECIDNEDCEDGNPCTTDICGEASECVHLPEAGVSCDDADACTTDDICDALGQCAGDLLPGVPDDPCRECTCDAEGGFTCDAANDGGECIANPSICTTGDTCLEGTCVPGEPVDIDDGNQCTEDWCDKGVVIHQPKLSGKCDDGNPCTVDDICNLGNCQPGDAVECVEEPCSSGVFCDPELGCVQTWLNAGSSCDDGSPCTEQDACDDAHACAGEFIPCNDGNLCTTDSCDPTTGDCVNEALPILDGEPCVPTDTLLCATGAHCEDGACIAEGEGNCDDGNPCTQDICGVTGCVHDANDTTNGLPCILNDICAESAACSSGICALTAALSCSDGVDCTLDECISGVGCTSTPVDQTVTCGQSNALDSDGCCCFAEDPTGDYMSAHVLDLDWVPTGTDMHCCLTPGKTNGCTDTAYISVSADGETWVEVTSFATTSKSKPEGGWEKHCVDLIAPMDFQYVRGANDDCYVDHFECTTTCTECTGLNGEICDDGNPCTADACDPIEGCSYIITESAACLILNNGNNLVSFGTLPANPTLEEVLGEAWPHLNFVFTEGETALRKEGVGVVGNLRLDRSEGYWVNLDLPTGMGSIAIPLPGTLTDPDLVYSFPPGLNSVSFSCGEKVGLSASLPDGVELIFDQWVGEGVAAFLSGDTWIGSLTHLEPNHGYEVSSEDGIASMQFLCPGSDGVDPHVHGCMHPNATNHDPAAEVDDGSCAFALPEGWLTPGWNTNQKTQAFAIFHDLDLDEGDAVAAFMDGECVGIGHPDGAFTTVPVMNGVWGLEQPVTFQWYDASAGAAAALAISGDVNWGLNATWWMGCTDPNASNHAPWAEFGTANCN